MSTTRCNCVVLVSGGIDSAACVDFYLQERFAVTGLHVVYGQPAATHEETAAKAIAGHYDIPLAIVRMEGSRAKLDGEIPARNAFLLFTALLELDTPHGIIALGIHSGTPYYDCSPGFLRDVQSVVDAYSDGRIRVASPFLDWTKRDIWEYSIQRSVPVELTYSCERGLDHPCGHCLSCRDLEALRVCQKLHNPA